MKTSTSYLLAVACSLALIGAVQADCCRDSLTLSYAVEGGTCSDAGGHSGTEGCTITICADGKAQVGTFCGRGTCFLFGCACKGGCISGNWKQSFLDINKDHKITVTGEIWNS
ncbi:protein Diedel-like [Drosophila montana]|uniref:protein Diedel-like n=1 Tax=Drosophila montana TaxID=40370 RepID=UPI00313DAC10